MIAMLTWTARWLRRDAGEHRNSLLGESIGKIFEMLAAL